MNRLLSSNCAACTFLGEELMWLSSSDAGGFILGGLITFKIFHKPSYEWAVVTKTVHKLKFCSCPNLMTVAQPQVIENHQKHMTT